MEKRVLVYNIVKGVRGRGEKMIEETTGNGTTVHI